MMSRASWFALLAVSIWAPVVARNAAAQELRAALTADTVTVGGVFSAVARVRVPSDHEVIVPDSMPVSGDLENAGIRYQAADTVADGLVDVTVMYPLAAWRPGEHEVPPIPVRVRGPDGGVQDTTATFPAIVIRSVLPADTAGVEPRPPRDVLGPDRVLWPWLLGILVAALALLALGIWLLRRSRRRAPEPVELPKDPRELALAALDRARSLGLLEAGDLKVFYSMVSEAVRRYLAALDDAWGVEWTTHELLEIIRGAIEEEDLVTLRDVLYGADMVKFARGRPTTDEALADWRRAREWVERFRWPKPSPEPVPAEAA